MTGLRGATKIQGPQLVGDSAWYHWCETKLFGVADSVFSYSGMRLLLSLWRHIDLFQHTNSPRNANSLSLSGCQSIGCLKAYHSFNIHQMMLQYLQNPADLIVARKNNTLLQLSCDMGLNVAWYDFPERHK